MTVGDANDDESGQWWRVPDSRPSSRARRTGHRPPAHHVLQRGIKIVPLIQELAQP